MTNFYFDVEERKNYRNRKYFILVSIAVSIFILGISFFLILYADNQISFLGKSDIVQSILGLVTSILIGSSSLLIIYFYNQYKSNIDNNIHYKIVIDRIKEKYGMLLEEVSLQIRKYEYDFEKTGDEKIKNILEQLNEEEFLMKKNKIRELENAFGVSQNLLKNK